MVALGLKSGAVYAKATTSGRTCLSSFEAELDGLKSVIRIRHILQELLPDFTTKGTIFGQRSSS